MDTLQRIMNSLTLPNGQGQYTLDGNSQTFATSDGQVVTLVNGKLDRLITREPDAGARQVYHYFKFIRDRAVLPSQATNKARPLSAEQRGEIIKECIAKAFITPLQSTTYEILMDRICRDYSFYPRNESSKYPADMQQLTAEALRDFVRTRIDAWKYEIVRRFQDELAIVMENFDSSLVEIILSLRLEAKAQELLLQKMFNPGKLQPISGLLYRGGSLHEFDKAKRLKTGQPCFDIHMVNKGRATFGRGLYTSPLLHEAISYSGESGVILEITVNEGSGLMQFDNPLDTPLNNSLLNGIPPSRRTATTNTHLTPAQQSASNSCSTVQTDIIPIINDVPHPLVGSIKCNSDISLIVNPRLVQSIKIFDNKLRTKIDLDFSAEEIVKHKMVPKFIHQLPASQHSPPRLAKLIDPLTCQSSERPIVQVKRNLPCQLFNQRSRQTEIKFYTPAGPNQWLRVKPRYTHDFDDPVNDNPFVISYTRSSGAARASCGSAVTPTPSGVRTDNNSAGAIAPGSQVNNCDVCLTDTNDGPTVRLSATQIRHQDCHAHAIAASRSPGDSIHGNMTWQVDYSPGLAHIAQEDPGSSGVIVADFNFVGPPSYNGRQLSPAARQKEFKHYMPNSLIGRQILKALQNAFLQGKVVTIDESNTTSMYGICFNLHLRTGCSYGDPHGYPCPNWSQSLIDGLLSAGVDIDLDDQNPQPTSSVLQNQEAVRE